MRKVAAAATLLSLAFATGASAQVLVPTDPFTGAVTGTNVAIVQGNSVAGPVGAVVAAPVGFVAGAVAGTVGAIGTVANALVGGPTYAPGNAYGAQPVYYQTAGAYPVETGSTAVYRRQAVRTAYVAPRRSVRTVYVAPRRTVRVAYAQPRRIVRGTRVVYRDRGFQRANYRLRSDGYTRRIRSY